MIHQTEDSYGLFARRTLPLLVGLLLVGGCLEPVELLPNEDGVDLDASIGLDLDPPDRGDSDQDSPDVAEDDTRPDDLGDIADSEADGNDGDRTDGDEPDSCLVLRACGRCGICRQGEACNGDDDCGPLDCAGGRCGGQPEVLSPPVFSESSELVGTEVLLTRDHAFASSPLDDRSTGVLFSYGIEEGWLNTAIHVENTPSGRDVDDRFATSFDVTGSTAFVGSPGRGDGVVRLYTSDGPGWRHSADIPGPWADTAELGAAVVADENHMAVLADNAGLKRVFFFKRFGGQWVSQEESLSSESLQFGTRMVLDKWLVVSDPQPDDSALIHVYEWPEPGVDVYTFRVTPPSGVEAVGLSIATYGDRLLVGSRGAVWVFEYDDGDWDETAFISPPDHFSGFGVAIDLFEERLVVGEVNPDSLYGRVIEYTFNGGGWDRGWTLESPSDDGDGFGLSVSLFGDRVLVGAPQHEHESDATGTVWLFDLCPGDTHGPQCEFSCTDGTRNGYENDVDCGGWCERCDVGATCSSDSQCQTRRCVGPGVCAPASPPESPVGDFGVSQGNVEVAVHNRMAAVAHSNFGDENIVSTYVLNGDVWDHFDTVTEAGGGFGSDVAVTEDQLVVGSRNSDYDDIPAAGAIHVFVRGASWETGPILTAEVPTAGGNLGVMVDAEPGYIVASAPGAAQVIAFSRDGTTWEQDHVFENVPDGAIALSLPWLVTTNFNPDGERARVFELDEDGWDTGTLLPIPGSPDNSFGDAVAINSDWIAVSAPLESGAETDRGAVYIFRYDDEWQFVQTIIPDSGVGSRFGASLWLTEETLAVGAPGFGWSGGTFLYGLEGNQWVPAGGYTVSDTGAGQDWGSTVAFSGDSLVTASMRHNTVGQAIIFDLCPSDLHGPFCMSSCSDGVKTGGETNIDCGGPCEPCD